MDKQLVKWTFNVNLWKPSVKELDSCIRCLSEDDKERIGKFSYLNDAKSCLIGRLMIRKFATNRLGISNQALMIRRSEKGRPYVANNLGGLNLDFNVTHQGKYVAFVGTANGPVGIDLMELEESRAERKDDFFRLMKRQFSPAEWYAIKAAGPYTNVKDGYDPQLATFYRLWTLKESYVKAIGVGIGFDLQRLSFKLNSYDLDFASSVANTELFVDGKADTDFAFEELLIDNSHVVTVSRKSDLKLEPKQFENVTAEQLLQNLDAIRPSDLDYCEMVLARLTNK